MTKCRVILALALWLCASNCIAQLGRGSEAAGSMVASFSVKDTPASDALIQLSRIGRFPMGIVEGADLLCRTHVSYSSRKSDASDVVDAIIAQVPGYSWERDSRTNVLHILPSTQTQATSDFLSLVDDRYGPIKANMQMLSAVLWTHIRYFLYPDQGSAGSVLGSTHDRLFEVKAENETVEQILDRIAVTSDGVWILRPLPPTLRHLGSELPFTILAGDDRSGPVPASFCAPVAEAPNDIK